MASSVKIVVASTRDLSIGMTPRKSAKFNKRQLFKIILITSICWLLLDLGMFYLFGHTRIFVPSEGSKMPFFKMRRSAYSKKSGENPGNSGDEIRMETKQKLVPGPSIEDELGKDSFDSVDVNEEDFIRENNDFQISDNVLIKTENNSTSNFENPKDKSSYANERFQDVVTTNNINSTNTFVLNFEPIRDVDVRTLPWSPSDPGENGTGVDASPGEVALVKAGYQRHRFNQHVSDRISFERSLTDDRNAACKKKQYPYASLPKTSVIICFTDEAWSALLRTVHSVLNRSPPELIAEILLVDDYSQNDDMKGPLDGYFRGFPEVRILRLPRREGLVRARLRAVSEAKGPVLTFLDSHVECMVGWLEPLLERISENGRAVISPSIDVIHTDTLKYRFMYDLPRGAFNWALTFDWYPVPLRDRKAIIEDITRPLRTPAIAGGLFAISKEFFSELGYYDPGLEIWGGENIEISLKTWLCGGSLEIHACSHVGHIFRKSQPYAFSAGVGETVTRNSQRIAETFLGPYRPLFYMHYPHLMTSDYGDVSERRQLLTDLKCHDFQWFLENVFPELHVPSLNVTARGAIKNLGAGMCADTMGGNKPLHLFGCHGLDSSGNFQLTGEGLIEHMDMCVQRDGTSGLRTKRACDQKYIINVTHSKNSLIMDHNKGECFDVSKKNIVILAPCDEQKTSQRWRFSVYV